MNYWNRILFYNFDTEWLLRAWRWHEQKNPLRNDFYHVQHQATDTVLIHSFVLNLFLSFYLFFFAKLLTDLILVMEPTIIFWENKRVIKKLTHLFQVSVWTLVTTKWWCFSKEFYFSCMIYFFLWPNCQNMFSHNE